MSGLSLLNARPNDFRRVAYSEFENDHVHKLFRHFPELQSSLQEVKELQTAHGRNWTEQTDPNKREASREIRLKSTHRLSELSKSSLSECLAPMDEMRKVLMRSRSGKASNSNSVSSRTSKVDSLRQEDSVTTLAFRNAAGAGAPSSSSATASLTRVGSSSSERKARASSPEQTTSVGNDEEPPAAGAYGNAAATKGQGDLAVAQAKLTKCSLSFNPNGNVNVLRGFQGPELTLSEFDSQLRRCLNIVLLKRELIALFVSMDVSGEGLIDGVEFTRYFLQMGIDARKRLHMETLKARWKAEEEERKIAEKEKEQLGVWQAEQVHGFTPADEAGIYGKLESVALHWDSTSEMSEVKLRGFDMYLAPFDFKVQLERSFGLKVSGAECGALLSRFITREGVEACVDGKMFMKFFTRMKKEVVLKHREHLARLALRKQRVKEMGQQEVCSKNLGR